MVQAGKLQSQDTGNDFVSIGKIVKAHGVKGEVKVFPFSRCPDNFNVYRKVILVDPIDGSSHAHIIQRARSQGKLAIVQFEDVVAREEAKNLCGFEVRIDKKDFPQLESNEYYWFRLKGLRVVTRNGGELGKITDIFNTKAHDVLVVTGRGMEYLIPFRDEIVLQIDNEAGKMIISPLPGLLELNSRQVTEPEPEV